MIIISMFMKKNIFSGLLSLRRYLKNKKRQRCFDFKTVRTNKAQFEKLVKNANIDYQSFLQIIAKETPVCSINDPKEIIEGYSILGLWHDYFGSTIFYKGNFYKGILNSKKNDFERIWATGVLQSLSKSKLIPNVQLTNFYSDDFAYFLKSETISIVPFKIWNKLMIIDSCKFVIKINRYLETKGLELADPHILNIAFTNNGFVYFDLGSFSKFNNMRNDYSIVFDAIVLLIAKESKTSLIAETGYSNEDYSRIGTDDFYYSPEVSNLLNNYIKFNKHHSSLIANKCIKDIFANFKVREEYLDLLFSDAERQDSITNKLKPGILDSFSASSIIGFGKDNFNYLIGITNKSNKRLINIEKDDQRSCLNYRHQQGSNYKIETYCFDYDKQVIAPDIIDSIHSELAILTVFEKNEIINIYKINKIQKYANHILLLISKDNYILNKAFITSKNIAYKII